MSHFLGVILPVVWDSHLRHKSISSLLTTANSHATTNDSNLRRRRPLTSSDHFPLAEEMTAVAMRPGAPHAPSTGDTNMLEETKEKKSFKIVTYVRFSRI